MSEEKVRDFLKTCKNESTLGTSVLGVFVLKLPLYKNSPPR